MGEATPTPTTWDSHHIQARVEAQLAQASSDPSLAAKLSSAATAQEGVAMRMKHLAAQIVFALASEQERSLSAAKPIPGSAEEDGDEDEDDGFPACWQGAGR